MWLPLPLPFPRGASREGDLSSPFRPNRSENFAITTPPTHTLRKTPQNARLRYYIPLAIGTLVVCCCALRLSRPRAWLMGQFMVESATGARLSYGTYK